MPDTIHRFNAWFRRLFAAAGAWFRRDAPDTTPQQRNTVAPTSSGADAVASQPWQASAHAHGFTTPPPDRQSPPAHGLTGEAFTGADITPQLTSLNPQSPAPFTPRPLAAHISRPLTARLDASFDASFDTRPGYPTAYMAPTSPASGQPPVTPYQASGPNDDTLPPRASGLPGLPDTPTFPGASDPSELGDLDDLDDLDTPTLPGLNSPGRAESAETPSGNAADDAPDRNADYAPYPLPPTNDHGVEGDDDEDVDGQATDKLAMDDALSAFDAPDGSPVIRRRMFFLRYLVRRRVYNEGFAPDEAPEQYHHSLGLDDDGADDTLPGL